jgi:hypothetical protein
MWLGWLDRWMARCLEAIIRGLEGPTDHGTPQPFVLPYDVKLGTARSQMGEHIQCFMLNPSDIPSLLSIRISRFFLGTSQQFTLWPYCSVQV